MKVVMIVANPFRDSVWIDPRMGKEAHALVKFEHEVVVIGTGKYGQNHPSFEIIEGVTIIRRPTILHRLYNWLSSVRSYEQQKGRERQAYYQKKNSHGFRARLIAHFLQFMYDLNNLLFCIAVLPQAILQKADMYEAHDFNALPAAFLAARLTGARLIYNSHEIWTERVRGVPYGRWHKAIVSCAERFLCRQCDLVITMSDSAAQWLSNHYDIPLPLVVLNVHPYTEPGPSEEIRDRLTDGMDQRVVIYVGYLDYGKGLEQLLDTVAYLNDGIKVAIVGDGVLRPLLEARAKAQNIESRVLFLGWVTPEELSQYVAAADLGVSPIQRSWLNYYHNLDNKFFHYITGGIPMAVSDHPEKRRIIEKYGIGATFDETDPRDIARVINKLLSNPTEYQAMRERAAKVGREELNWDVVSKRYVAAIEALVKRKSDSLPDQSVR